MTDEATCEELVRELPSLLDHEVAPGDEARLRRHLDSCARCLAKYRFEDSLIAMIKRRLRSTPIPDGLTARLMTVLARAGAEGG